MTAKVDRYIANKLDPNIKTDVEAKQLAGYNKYSIPERSEAYQRAIEKYISEPVIYKALTEGLSSTKPIVNQGELIDYPDYTTRHKYIETALKLKGDLAPEQTNVQVNNTVDLSEYFSKKEI